MAEESVCAVVVTFNRRSVLDDCLSSLVRARRQPDKILLVDNASTDGSAELVRRKFPQVQILQLAENTGCAGGFKVGIHAALLSGCTLIWLMDDDHVARPDTLLRFLEAAAENSDYDVFGSVLHSPHDENTLTSRFVIDGRLCSTYEELLAATANGLIGQAPTAYNGVLYRAKALQKVGLPDERFFIRGDDLDYWLRLEKAEVRSVTVAAVRMSHPTMFDHEFPVAPFLRLRLTAHCTDSPLKNYCLFRNRAFCFKKHRRYRTLVIDLLRYPLFFLINRRADINGLLFWARAYLHGLIGVFGRERRFLSS